MSDDDTHTNARGERLLRAVTATQSALLLATALWPVVHPRSHARACRALRSRGAALLVGVVALAAGAGFAAAWRRRAADDATRRAKDEVDARRDEALDQSFPASDPPASGSCA